jgi:hypothetical protein
MTNTIEPMELDRFRRHPDPAYEHPRYKLKAHLFLKNRKKLDKGAEEPIIKHIWEVLPNDKITGYEVSYEDKSILLHFSNEVEAEEGAILLFKHKIVDNISNGTLQEIFRKEWREYEKNFENYIRNKISNQ